MAINFGEILDNTISAYESVSVARANRDTARYIGAGNNQANAFHRPEAVTQVEAYNTGNAKNPGEKAISFSKPVVVAVGVAVAALLWSKFK